MPARTAGGRSAQQSITACRSGSVLPGFAACALTRALQSERKSLSDKAPSADLKSAEPFGVPGVRIPPSPFCRFLQNLEIRCRKAHFRAFRVFRSFLVFTAAACSLCLPKIPFGRPSGPIRAVLSPIAAACRAKQRLICRRQWRGIDGMATSARTAAVCLCSNGSDFSGGATVEVMQAAQVRFGYDLANR